MPGLSIWPLRDVSLSVFVCHSANIFTVRLGASGFFTHFASSQGQTSHAWALRPVSLLSVFSSRFLSLAVETLGLQPEGGLVRFPQTGRSFIPLQQLRPMFEFAWGNKKNVCSRCVCAVHAAFSVLVLHSGAGLLRLPALQPVLWCETEGECA